MGRFKSHLATAAAAVFVLVALILSNVGRVGAQSPMQPFPDTEYAARHAVTLQAFATVTGASEDLAVYPVPPGKRLVIEYVVFVGTVPAGQRFWEVILEIPLPAPPGSFAHFNLLPTYAISDPTRDRFVVSQPVRLYADPGSTVILHANRIVPSEPIGSMNVRATISGYLVDVP